MSLTRGDLVVLQSAKSWPGVSEVAKALECALVVVDAAARFESALSPEFRHLLSQFRAAYPDLLEGEK